MLGGGGGGGGMLTKLKRVVVGFTFRHGYGPHLMVGGATNTMSNGCTSSSSSLLMRRTLMTIVNGPTSSLTSSSSFHGMGMGCPWFLDQRRGAKVLGYDGQVCINRPYCSTSTVRTGNIVLRKGRIYQVLKAQHTQHGRGGASIQVEMRDVDSGNKVTERFHTDEAIERVFVEETSFQYLYSEGDIVVLTDPETFDQIEVPEGAFWKSCCLPKRGYDS